MADDLEGLNFTIKLDGANDPVPRPPPQPVNNSETDNGYSYDKPEQSSSFFSGLANIFSGGQTNANENTYQSPHALTVPQSMSSDNNPYINDQ
jgi:hypothetical protein